MVFEQPLNNAVSGIGTIILVLGGFLACACILCLLGFALSCAWIAFSDSFRDICKAESLIFEYRKNQKEFLKWMEGRKDGN